MTKLPTPVSFDWDSANIEKNWKKHNVGQKESEEIFGNKPLIILKDVKHSQVEDRFIAYGATNKNRKLHIVFTVRKDKIRVISARNQSKKERSFYEKKD